MMQQGWAVWTGAPSELNLALSQGLWKGPLGLPHLYPITHNLSTVTLMLDLKELTVPSSLGGLPVTTTLGRGTKGHS